MNKYLLILKVLKNISKEIIELSKKNNIVISNIGISFSNPFNYFIYFNVVSKSSSNFLQFLDYFKWYLEKERLLETLYISSKKRKFNNYKIFFFIPKIKNGKKN